MIDDVWIWKGPKYFRKRELVDEEEDESLLPEQREAVSEILNGLGR